MTGPEALVRLPPGPGTRTARLAAALRDAIRSGRLAPASRVPASRSLAADLGLSRGVVVEAYDQLIAEGLLIARRGAGTMVAPTAMTAPARHDTASPHGPTDPHGARGPDGASAYAGAAAAQVRAVGAGGPGPDGALRAVRPLRPGVPDLAAFPRPTWLRAYRAALSRAPHGALGYGDPAGAAELRAALAEYAGRVRAARCTASRIVVTGGVAQGLALLARTLVAEGARTVIVEDPGSAETRGQLAAHGLAPVPVPVDADGLVTAALPTGRAAAGVGAVLVTPAHQYPLGVVLAPGRRAELLGWARRHRALVIEDDYDAEFRYDREPVGCLQGSGPDVVALASSASKPLAPGLRLGWLAVPADRLAAVIEAKRNADLGEPTLEQLAFAELLRAGRYDEHLRRARRNYRRRRDALAAALARWLPQARVTGIAAGLHLVAELPAGADTGTGPAAADVDEAAILAAADAAGLAPAGLTAARVRSTGPPGLILGYGAHPEPVLADAVRRLAAIVEGAPRLSSPDPRVTPIGSLGWADAESPSSR